MKYKIEYSDTHSVDSLESMDIKNFLICDRPEAERHENIDFHVESGNYFGTLATILDLFRQEGDNLTKRQKKSLACLREDLGYMQKTFRLKRKK